MNVDYLSFKLNVILSVVTAVFLNSLKYLHKSWVCAQNKSE